jgi:hypothetical protein
MRRLYKILLIVALLGLTGLSCEAVTVFGEEIPSGPVDQPASALVFKPAQLPDAQVGADYSAQVTVEDTRTPVGEFSLQDGEVPPGLVLKAVEGVENTAEVSGTPTQAGTYKFVLYVWCYGTNQPGQTGEKEYTIVVK